MAVGRAPCAATSASSLPCGGRHHPVGAQNVEVLVYEVDVFFGETGLRHGGPIVGTSKGIGALRVEQPVDPRELAGRCTRLRRR